jgi:hypothetical protein
VVVLDNDGTPWVEQPMKAILENDFANVIAGGEKNILEVLKVTHAGMTTDAFAKLVEDWMV